MMWRVTKYILRRVIKQRKLSKAGKWRKSTLNKNMTVTKRLFHILISLVQVKASEA